MPSAALRFIDMLFSSSGFPSKSVIVLEVVLLSTSPALCRDFICTDTAHIANPVHASLRAETSLGIIGRNDQVGGRPQVFLFSKRDRSRRIGVLFSPHLTQDLNGGKRSQLRKLCCCIDGCQKVKSITSNRRAPFVARPLGFT